MKKVLSLRIEVFLNSNAGTEQNLRTALYHATIIGMIAYFGKTIKGNRSDSGGPILPFLQGRHKIYPIAVNLRKEFAVGWVERR